MRVRWLRSVVCLGNREGGGVNWALVVVLTQNGQADCTNVGLIVLDGLSVAGAGYGRVENFVGNDHLLPHLHLGEEVVGEEAVERLAAGGAHVHAVGQRRGSLQEGGVLVVELANVDGAARAVAEDGVHEIHVAADGVLGDVENEEAFLDLLIGVFV